MDSRRHLRSSREETCRAGEESVQQETSSAKMRESSALSSRGILCQKTPREIPVIKEIIEDQEKGRNSHEKQDIRYTRKMCQQN